ncbi:amidohydrolase family protein [Rhodococcus pseudokoreensis]|uniref:Amidohydrolase family protein n=1 Tax=Rhodococcus pseudokoreensis TaxID=2811421 RepID=A0A974WBN9_9NOCA|nr:amidohydrolase family protein [Rhodococcus pseudokoreensis]QSE94921.1 amidohydrolase family protein [Rhodococcus pseudokoreensis]
MTTRTRITGVRVFDGEELLPLPMDVTFDADGIVSVTPAGSAGAGAGRSGDVEVDGGGATVLPGLIDAHIHLHDADTLQQLAGYGATTGLDMATWPAEKLAGLREIAGRGGLADFRSPGLPAIGPAGPHSRFVPADAVVTGPEQAGRFVDARIAEGADYIKIVAEAPGDGSPDLPTLTALVGAAHRAGKKVIAHAATAAAFTMALDAGADMLTHIPLGRPLDPDTVRRMVAEDRIAIPTLALMEGIAAAHSSTEAFAGSLRSVGALHSAGTAVLAGTDANTEPGAPTQVAHGTSLHHELGLLVDAGLTPTDALRAATSRTADAFDLPDRGRIRPGLRADLLLVDGDPTSTITATRCIRAVYVAGTPVRLPSTPQERR